MRQRQSDGASRALRGRNRVRLYTEVGGELVSHFWLREFESAAGFVMIHASVPRSLELLRRDLCREEGEEAEVLVTDAVRTEDDLLRLARRYGWTDEGGAVSRDSRHLAMYGGVAVDIVARVRGSGHAVSQARLGAVSRRYFDFVQDDYPDGHVHADNRCSV